MEKPFRSKFFDSWWVVYGYLGLMVVMMIEVFLGSWFVLMWTALGGLSFFAIALRRVPIASAGVVTRFGRRVIVGYYRAEVLPKQPRDLAPEEIAELLFGPDFRPIDPNIRTKYLVRGEGWRLVFPGLEGLTIFSLKLRQRLVDAQNTFTRDAVKISPKTLAFWRIKDIGQVIEFEPAKDDESLVEAVDNVVRVAQRDTFSECQAEDVLRRSLALPPEEAKKLKAKRVYLGDRMRSLIIGVTEEYGVEVIELRVEDIEPDKSAEDVFDAAERRKTAEFEKTSAITDAEKDLATRTLKANAALIEAQKEARGLRAKVAEFVGKDPEGALTHEDSEAYASFLRNLELAKGFGAGTKWVVAGPDIFSLVQGKSLASMLKGVVS